jgi:uncharacterized membrane protein
MANSDVVAVCSLEYEKLKDEQRSRIGFRDNLVFATIAAIGAVLSYALQSPSRHSAFLVLPPLCFALGWTYLMNDQKITAIGDYLASTLAAQMTASGIERPFGWERQHREDDGQAARKLIQLLVDLVLFYGTPVTGIVAYLHLTRHPPIGLVLVAGVELALLGLLAVQILWYARVPRRGRTVT